MHLDPKSISKQENYKLLIGSVLPRPIAFVTTLGQSGQTVNAAPFSFFNVVCTDPPLLGISIGRRNGLMKDTSRNIRETGEFVVHVVDESIVEAVNQTSCDYPPDISEVSETGLTLVASEIVQVPRIQEAKIAMECKLHQMLELGDGPASDFIIGEVVRYVVEDSLLSNGRIDTQDLNPIGRLAGTTYVKLGSTFDMPRPVYKGSE